MLVIVAATTLLIGYESSFKSSVPEREMEATNADYVAQAAMQHAVWQKDNYACGGDFSIPTTAFGSHSYSGSIGSAATTTNNTFNPDHDAWIRESAPNDNYGNQSELRVKNKASDSFRALYHYDLSSIAAGATVESATAWFYVTSNDDEAAVEIHSVTANWTEPAVTWNNIAASFDATIMGNIPIQVTKPVWVSVDITALAQQWVNDPAANYGFTLIATSSELESRYTSSEFGIQKPYLDITTSIGAVSPVQISVTGTLSTGVSRTLTQADVPAYKTPSIAVLQPDSTEGIDTYIWESNKNTNFGDDADSWVATGNNNVSRILLKFNLDAVPTGVRVLSAMLSLHHSGGSDPNVPVTAHRIFNPWTEDYVTFRRRDNGIFWTTDGGDFDASVVATSDVGPTSSIRYEWDIATLADGWLSGNYPNHGVALQTVEPGIFGERFDTSDHADATRHPRLTIEYACECGTVCLAPQGSGRILMVIGDNPASPSPGDTALRDRFEIWGYAVVFMEDINSQANFAAAAAMSDAVYISTSVSSGTVGNKLKNVPIGVLTAKAALLVNMGIASGGAHPIGDRVNIVDTSHYITSVFPLGPAIINRGSMEGLTSSGTDAPGAQRLADWGGVGALLALDAGANLWNGGAAAGRRVMLPLGRENNIHLDYWTNSGALIVQRSLAWAIGADVVGRRLLMVVVNPNSLTSQEQQKSLLLKSWGYSVRFIDQSDSQSNFNDALAANDVVFVPEDVNVNELGTKLTASTIGVATDEPNLSDELGFSDSVIWGPGTQLAVDNNYYVTSPLPAGQVSVLSTNEDIAGLSGAIAPQIQVIGSSSGDSALVALEAGAQTIDGAAAGRRIMLPWGNSSFDVGHLNSNGLAIFERAIQWAADPGGVNTNPYVISTDSNAALGGLSFTDIDLASYAPWADTASLFFDGSTTTLNVDIDALHVLANGHLLLSPNGDANLGGLSFTGDDLVDYDVAMDTSTLIFEGSTLFSDANERIISVHVLDNGHYVLSTDSNAILGGLSFTDRDLVEYDPAANTASLFFDGSTTTLNSDIAAVQILPNGHIVLSPTGNADLGGLSFGAGDLVDYDPLADTAALIFDGSALFSDPAEKIISLHIGSGSGSVVGGGACDGTFRDEFSAISFSGSNGSLTWAGDWLEIAESGGANSGDTRVMNDQSNYQLRTRDNDGGGEGVEREADLSGAASATLSYVYRRQALDNPNDFTSVQVRLDSGSSWSELTRHQGGGTDGSYQSASHDISAFISSTTQIRILTSPNMGINDIVWFDDIQILCSP
jgi:hypothetical protein